MKHIQLSLDNSNGKRYAIGAQFCVTLASKIFNFILWFTYVNTESHDPNFSLKVLQLPFKSNYKEILLMSGFPLISNKTMKKAFNCFNIRQVVIVVFRIYRGLLQQWNDTVRV